MGRAGGWVSEEKELLCARSSVRCCEAASSTGMPRFVISSIGMLLVPAPQRATARTLDATCTNISS